MKEDIRRRRQERIRQLSMGQAPTKQSSWKQEEDSDPWSAEDRVDKELEQIEEPNLEEQAWLTSLNRLDDTEMDHAQNPQDPEQAWKQSRVSWEERYGWSENPDEPKKNRWLRTLKLQFAGALLLGVIAVASVQLSTPWQSQAKAFLTASLTENINLEPIAVWYRATFGGSPAFIPIWESNTPETKQVHAASKLSPPLAGTVVQSFAVSMSGIELAPSGSDTIVRSAATGRVVKVDLDKDEHMTVTVQHADGYSTIYGHLATCEVKPDDWVEAGDELGLLSETADPDRTLYFAVTKNGQYVDPVDVMDLG